MTRSGRSAVRGRRDTVKAAGALVLGFALGTWFGSERTIRRIRFYADPANRPKTGASRRASENPKDPSASTRMRDRPSR